jgi:hypothetical protein
MQIRRLGRQTSDTREGQAQHFARTRRDPDPEPGRRTLPAWASAVVRSVEHWSATTRNPNAAPGLDRYVEYGPGTSVLEIAGPLGETGGRSGCLAGSITV